MDEQIKKRLLSLLWRIGGMVLVTILSGLMTMLSDGTINIPAPYVVLAGLITGEITKFVNNTK